MTAQFDAVIAGHLCLDIIPDLSAVSPDRFPTLFQPGQLREIGPATCSTGGAVSNTGLALHILGVPVRLMGKIGDDAFGQVVRRIIDAYDPRLRDGMAVDPQASTSYTLVISPPGIDRLFLHCPGANDTFTAADIRYDLLERARLFHFGYPPLMRQMYRRNGDQLVAVFRQAKATGITTSLDMSLPDPSSPSGQADWPAILRRVLPFVDIFLPSIEEILFMLRPNDYRRMVAQAGSGGILPLVTPGLLTSLGRELLELGVKIAGLKLGDRGFYLCTAGQDALASLGRAGPADLAAWAGRELWAACFQVRVAGATGAGDATIAGFLTAFLRGLPPEEAVTAATAVGACSVEAPDALSGLRPWEDTLDRVRRGWPRRPLTVNAPGWWFNPAYRIWQKT
ncbi:MAG: carbohydrate kinase family protein [Chloroflexi bacterium]|nr:MAG: carbohydrate kinase family protein [Chloroflexota bacterium]